MANANNQARAPRIPVVVIQKVHHPSIGNFARERDRNEDASVCVMEYLRAREVRSLNEILNTMKAYQS